MGGTTWVYMAVHSQSVSAQSMEHGNASWCVIGSSNGYPTTHTHVPQFANRAQRTPASTVRENVPQALGPRLHATGGVNVQYSFLEHSSASSAKTSSSPLVTYRESLETSQQSLSLSMGRGQWIPTHLPGLNKIGSWRNLAGALGNAGTWAP